jgi:solute carrier family 25 carnitine/acylcarnitine transporter 20/29
MNTEFISGIFGGITGILLSHPIDTIRIRIQTQTQPLHLNGLYKGIIPPLIGMSLEKSIVFGVHGLMKNRGYSDFISGITAGFACTTIVTPIEKFKINMQCGNKIKISNLYKGYTPTLFREVPGFGIYFWTYNKINQNKFFNNLNLPEPLKIMFTGGLSGAISWLFIYPSDVIKTRMQSDNLKYNSISYLIKDTYQKYGIKFFYNGIHLAIIRAFILHSGVWLGFIYSNKFINCNYF